MQTAPLPRGALRNADLGYFAVPVFATYAATRMYWLSRYHPQTLVVTVDGQPLDLIACLHAQRGMR